MPKCDLSIELDDPQAVYEGGGKISGTVTVSADADVKCKGLDVSSGWKTHGRGNVASGQVMTETLFAGEWTAGAVEKYRFELPVAHWPPSYHGHYLNVDHYIEARAKIPWGFDPKASVPFLMRPTCGPEGAHVPESQANQLAGWIGCLIIAAVIAVFTGVGGMFAVAMWPFGLLIPLAIGGIGFGFYLFRVWLPKHLLGEVKYFLAEETVSPGDVLSGELVIQPRKNVEINGVTMRIEAREQCVSGSGSNRTTHKNVLFERTVVLQDPTVLQGGNEHRFEIRFPLPNDAPYSMDLNDNDLIWNTTLRVDIPRWPDWKKDLTLTLVPNGALPPEVTQSTRSSPAPRSGKVDPAADSGSGGGGITFAETAQHLLDARDDRDQVEVLVEAVSGLTFAIEAIVERRLLYAGEEDPHVYHDGYAVWAHHVDPALPMVLYVPHELADEFENIGRDTWRGRGTIVGWDSQHGRLQVKLERPQ